MDTIDVYVLSVMVYAICVLLFKGGMIRHKWAQTKRNERVFDFVLLVPYFLAVISGVFLIITKEVVL